MNKIFEGEMRDFILFIIVSTIVIFALNDGIYSQDDADNSVVADTQAMKVNVNDYLDDLLDENEQNEDSSDTLTFEEAKKKFDELSPEQKKDIIERWNELKKLSPEQRQKAVENFRRLVKLETQNSKQETSGNQEVQNEPKNNFKMNINPENVLMHLVRIEFNEAHSNRLHQYTEFILAIKRDEPGFFDKIRKYSGAQRQKEIMNKRNQIIESEIEDIAQKLELDEDVAENLKNLIQKHVKQTDKQQFGFIKKMDKIWENSFNLIQIQTKTGTKIINNLRDFPEKRPFPLMYEDGFPSQPGKQPRMPFGKRWNRSMFKIPDTTQFSSILDSLELQEETQELILEIYDEIIDMFKSNKKMQVNKNLFWAEVISRTCMFLDKEHIQKLSEFMTEKPERRNKPEGSGFRSNQRNSEGRNFPDGRRNPGR